MEKLSLWSTKKIVIIHPVKNRSRGLWAGKNCKFGRHHTLDESSCMVIPSEPKIAGNELRVARFEVKPSFPALVLIHLDTIV